MFDLAKALDKALATIHETVRQATASRALYSDLTATADEPREFKSFVDRDLHELLSRNLSRGGEPIVSEEDDASHSLVANCDYYWLIDPLDGTVNYIRGISHCCVSIALVIEGIPVIGVLADLSGEIIYSATLASKISDPRLKVSSIRKPSDAILCSGFPARFDINDSDQMTAYFARIAAFGKVRMLGSASASLLHVALGKADAYYERDIMIWDVAAGMVLVEMAGGCIASGLVFSAIKQDVYAHNGSLELDLL